MPADGSSDDGERGSDHAFVYCPSCGSKAASSWSYCRACRSSLADARPAKPRPRRTFDVEERGCPKCGHEEAEVDEVATTGAGLTRVLDLQNRRFHAVSCTNCGYTEFYRGDDADVILDFFLGG
jgi:hypothetical protein